MGGSIFRGNTSAASTSIALARSRARTACTGILISIYPWRFVQRLYTAGNHPPVLRLVVVLWAKNRLNKFYNPKLYKAPPARDLSDEQSVTVGMGGTLAPTPAPGGIANTGIGALAQIKSSVAPPPPPETFGPYQKKGESGNGV